MLSTETKVPILMYHKLVHTQSIQRRVSRLRRDHYVIPREEFQEQMHYLKSQGYSTISLGDLAKCVNQQGILPQKSVIITFDDGDESHYSIAYPILSSYQFTATFFVIANSLGNPGSLSLPQIHEMVKQGMSIQSHTLSHTYLTYLNEHEIEREFKMSKAVLEEKLNRPINFVAIPRGIYNKKVISIARQTGYKGVVTSDLGINNFCSDLYRLKRICIYPGTSLKTFANLLEGRGMLARKSVRIVLHTLRRALGIKNYERCMRLLQASS